MIDIVEEMGRSLFDFLKMRLKILGPMGKLKIFRRNFNATPGLKPGSQEHYWGHMNYW